MKTTIALLASLLLAGIASAATVKPYTKDTCLVTDNKLGEMGTPITKVYGDQEIKFCCKPCVKKFEKNQEKYLKKLQENK